MTRRVDPAEQGRLWYEIGRASALKYDGEGFVAAMEKALELGAPGGDVYAELGYQVVQRAGMWLKRPDTTVVNSWIDKALELTEEGSRARAKGLVAHAVWPAVNQAALARAFDGLASQAITFDQCDVQVRGAVASATCRGTR